MTISLWQREMLVPRGIDNSGLRKCQLRRGTRVTTGGGGICGTIYSTAQAKYCRGKLWPPVVSVWWDGASCTAICFVHMLRLLERQKGDDPNGY